MFQIHLNLYLGLYFNFCFYKKKGNVLKCKKNVFQKKLKDLSK